MASMLAKRIVPLTFALTTFSALAGSQANAGFTYTSTAQVTTHTGNFGGSSVTFGSVSSGSTQTVPTYENLFNVNLTSTTAPPATDTFTVNFVDAITITNVPPPGSSATGTLIITGSITFTRSDSGGEISSLTIDPGQNLTIVVDSQSYTLSGFTYTQPTVNNTTTGSGNVSALFSATTAPVPEPASLAMLGMGMAGLGMVAYRRRRAS